MQRLTERIVRSTNPSDKRIYIRDSELSNLELQITPAGTKTYYVCYSETGRNKRLKLGRAQLMTATEARQLARKALLKLDMGETFQPEPGALTVRELIQNYIDHCEFVRKRSPATLENYRGELSRINRRLLNTTADEVTRVQAHEEFDRRTQQGAVTANRMLALIRAAYTHAINRGLVHADPFASIQKNLERPRKVFITFAGLPEFWLKLMKERQKGDMDAADCIALMLFTGLRVGNALAIKWSDVDLETGRIFVAKTKNGDPAVVYCTGVVLEMLRTRDGFKDSPLVFSGRKSVRYAMRRINKKIAIQGLCAHAMRHTFTNVARRVIDDLKLIEVMTSHRTGSLTVNTYMHLEECELREAFATVSSELVRLSRIDKNCFDVVIDSG